MAMERVVKCMLKIKKWPSHWLPEIALEPSKKMQKAHNNKFLSSIWIHDIEKWFGWWDVTHLLHDASIDPFTNEAILQRQHHFKWLHLSRKWYSSSNEEAKHVNTILDQITLSIIWIVVSIRLSCHSLYC